MQGIGRSTRLATWTGGTERAMVVDGLQPGTGYRAPTSRYAETIRIMIFAQNFAWGEKGR
jgi:hypothetical protein